MVRCRNHHRINVGAAEHFAEALRLAPDDPAARRLLQAVQSRADGPGAAAAGGTL